MLNARRTAQWNSLSGDSGTSSSPGSAVPSPRLPPDGGSGSTGVRAESETEEGVSGVAAGAAGGAALSDWVDDDEEEEEDDGVLTDSGRLEEGSSFVCRECAPSHAVDSDCGWSPFPGTEV